MEWSDAEPPSLAKACLDELLELIYWMEYKIWLVWYMYAAYYFWRSQILTFLPSSCARKPPDVHHQNVFLRERAWVILPWGTCKHLQNEKTWCGYEYILRYLQSRQRSLQWDLDIYSGWEGSLEKWKFVEQIEYEKELWLTRVCSHEGMQTFFGFALFHLSKCIIILIIVFNLGCLNIGFGAHFGTWK